MRDGWEPVWGAEAAEMLCYNVFEEDDAPVHPPCTPAEDGITWIDLNIT